MGSVKAHSWKELVEQAEIAEKSAERDEPSVPQNRWNFNKNKDRGQSSQPKGKETMVIETPKDTSSHPQKANVGGNGNQQSRPPQRQYSFKEEHVVTIFHLLNKGNKLKLPEVKRPEEVGRTNDPNYCLYHRMIHHPTARCYVLKDKIQALVDAGALSLKSEQKKVGANVISLKFGEMPEVRVQNGVSPIAKGEMKVRSVAAKQKDEGFIPVTTQSGEVMWVHPDIVHDEQWTKVSRKGKNKSSNVISVSKEADVALPETLYSDEERLRVLTAQPATAQQQGTRSGQAYLKQYDQVVGPAP